MPVIGRILLGAVFAGLAMNVAALLFFAPAQAVLADPELQSSKFIRAFAGDPPPRAADIPYLFQIGLMALGLPHAIAFQLIYRGLPRNWFAAGLVYGFAAWLIAYFWFEFYLPWNVMREPAPLVLLELACWLGVMVFNGLALAAIYRKVLQSPPRPLVM